MARTARLAAIAALAAVAALSTACTPVRLAPRAALVDESGFAALWPEQRLAEASAAQSAVDSGAEELAWRLDPRATAQRFANQVLGWSGSTVVRDERWALSSGIEIARVWLCEPNGCPPSGAAYDQEVVLKRLAESGPGGIWSVTDVTSGRLLVDEIPRIRIRNPVLGIGRTLSAVTRDLPDGTKVLAGSTTLGDCGPTVHASTPTVRLSRFRFQVSTSLGSPCEEDTRPPGPEPGYVFVLPRERGMRVEPETLFTEPRPGGRRPIPDLTAIAVRFVPRARVPRPPAPWLSRDPESLPRCRAGELRASLSAGRAVSGFGVGIVLEVRRHGIPACHATLDLRLRLADGTGEPIRVRGDHEIRLDGYLPGYVPGPPVVRVAWGLYDWCGRRVPGPIELHVTGIGEPITLRSNELAMWCPPGRTGAPELERVPL